MRFENSIFCEEKLIHDGIEISSRFSITGTKHRFKIGEDNCTIETKNNMFDKTFIVLEITKNNSFIKKEILKLTFIERLPWIIFGVISGIFFYQLILLIAKLI